MRIRRKSYVDIIADGIKFFVGLVTEPVTSELANKLIHWR